FVLASLDEAAMVHERVQILLRRGFPEDTWRYSLTAIAFTSFLALAGAAVSWRLFRAVSARTAALFVAAGVLFVGGAVIVDLAASFHHDVHGDGPAYATFHGVEEAMEMSGVATFVIALLGHLRA